MKRVLKLIYKYYITSRPESSPLKQNDFPMYVENFDFEKYKKEIFSFGNNFEVVVAKTIEYKNEIFEIFRIETKNNQAKKKLLVFATVHGNEFVTALVVPRLLKDILENSNFYKEWQIRVIAPVNPVGLKYQSRYNKDGYDINRDFKNFKTDEAKLQKDEINIFKPDLVVSLHEHPHNGFMFFCTDKVSKFLEQKILYKLKEKNVLLWKSHSFSRLPGIKVGVVRLSFVPRIVIYILGLHALGRYLSRRNIGEITSESCWNEKDIEKRLFPHLLLLQSVIEDF